MSHLKHRILWILALAATLPAWADKEKAALTARSFMVEGSIPYVAMVRRNMTEDFGPRMVEGVPAQAGARPWQVALVGTAYDNVRGQFCGGTLIAQKWVATAAHCVDGGMQPFQLAVLPGILSLKDPGAKRVAVKRIVVHPQWNPSTTDFDIALLELDSAVPTSPKAKAVPIASTQADPAVGAKLTVSGWGATKEGGPGSVILLTADIPVVSRETCNKAASYDGGITGNMICAGREQGGIDSCQGDSGGPAITGAGANPVLAGVVSWGTGCARREKYGVYTHVGRLSGWIKSTAGL